MSDTTAAETVAATKAISEWLSEIGISDPKLRAEVSVDLADILAAARRIESDMRLLLQPRSARGQVPHAALTLAANIEVQLFTELAGHLKTLRTTWPKVLHQLDKAASK
jgi:hypothetical protein